MKRTFIAIKILPDKNLLNAYNEIINSFENDKIKWVEPDNFHITLKFLGDTQDIDIQNIAKDLEIIGRHKEFPISIENFGVFPNIRSPRVFWFGVKNFLPLEKIKNEIDNIVQKYGFATDTKKFKPHLTIARPKFINDRKIIEKFIEKYQNKTIQEAKIDKIIFYESTLTRQGAIYTPIKTINLTY